MSIETVATELQRFDLADTAIAAMRAEYMPLTICGLTDTVGYKAVHSARMVVKNHRVQVEKVRKELKADALEYGRRVDAEAKRITAMLEPIEGHLARKEDAYEAEKERIRNAERLRLEAEQRAKEEAEAARVKAEQEAEAARIKAVQEGEDARLKVEAGRLAEQQRKIDEERREIETERKRLADIEAARLREIETQRREKEAAERARIETEQRIAREAEAAKAKAAAEEAARIKAEALRPDREKLLTVAAAVNAIDIPEVSIAADDAADRVRIVLGEAEQKIRTIVEKMSSGIFDDMV